jgi:hypothetical protein
LFENILRLKLAYSSRFSAAAPALDYQMFFGVILPHKIGENSGAAQSHKYGMPSVTCF